MQYVPLHVQDLAACPCGEHAVVKLANAEGRPRARIRIAAQLARALPVHDAGLSSAPATVVTALVACLRATGVEPTALVLWREGDEVRVALRMRSGSAETEVPIEPGVGFLTARCLDLEILLARPARSEPRRAPIPEVYRPVLDALLGEDAE